MLHLRKDLATFNMNKIVDDLVLVPFRDIVDHGEAAINSAEDHGNGEMLRAAQLLVKEGERALKKIEPVCRKGYDEYGSSFVDALLENGISRLSPYKFHIKLTIHKDPYPSSRRSSTTSSMISKIMWKPTGLIRIGSRSCTRCHGRLHHAFFILSLA